MKLVHLTALGLYKLNDIFIRKEEAQNLLDALLASGLRPTEETLISTLQNIEQRLSDINNTLKQ